MTVIHARRYRCQRCGAVHLSVPYGVLPRRRYGAVAIALALALHAAGESGRRVRDAVSPRPCSGYVPLHGWRSVRRWTLAAPALWPRIRGPTTMALEVSRQLAAHAPVPSGQLVPDAAAGALEA